MTGIGHIEQEAASRAAIASVLSFLGGPSEDKTGWGFEFGEHLESNWGAVYGGALAAGTLAVARSVAPERSPRSLHIQMVRSVPRGTAYAAAKMRHSGRTVGTVEVELYDERRKLAAIALVTMVTPDAVAATYNETTATPPFHITTSAVDPEHLDFGPAPIRKALDLVTKRDGIPVMLHADNARTSVDGSVAGVGECTLPWENLEFTGPEAACLASDASIGIPIMRSFIPVEAMGPNPDLTLRFTTAPATRVIKTAAMMLSVQRGTTTVALEVQAGDQQLAHGLATSLLLDR